MKYELAPLHEFLEKDITPQELVGYLDALEHECSMNMLRNKEQADEHAVDGLYYLHSLRKTLERCSSD